MGKGLLYEGKAKKIFGHDDDHVIIHYKDDATAFNGEKREEIASKGKLNNTITEIIFTHLEKSGIKTHFVKKLSERDQLCKKVEIIPLEVIIRNKAAGSMSKRYGVKEGTKFREPIFELSYKNDDLGDPLMNDDHAVMMDLATRDEVQTLRETALKINELLVSFFKERGVELIDFKLEFGRFKGEIILGDEISPDTCRFWDLKTGERMDKDRFRMDLGDVTKGYETLLGRLK